MNCHDVKYLWFNMKYINVISLSTVVPKNIRLKPYYAGKYVRFMSAIEHHGSTVNYACILYVITQHDMILRTSEQCQRRNIDDSWNSPKHPHTWIFRAMWCLLLLCLNRGMHSTCWNIYTLWLASETNRETNVETERGEIYAIKA